MGYDLHITRAEDWTDNDAAQISAEEWLAVVRADPELRLAPEAGMGPYFATWTGPSRHAEPWLNWSAGNIYTKNPDSALLRKLVSLAAQLGGRVQGDDGELYTGEEPLDEYLADAGQTSARASAPPASWWRRLFGR